MSLGTKIVKIRKDNKMSQEDFAEIFHVTRQTISSWENEKSYPDIETLIQISNTFHISLDVLLKGNEKMIKEIDKFGKENKKFKKIIIALITVLIIIAIGLLLNRYLTYQKKKTDRIKYEEIISNLNTLGFDKKDGIGFSKIVEDGITYKVYTKMPEALDTYISASTEWTDEEAIVIDYNGKRIAATYINESVTTIYLNKDGSLKNEKQNKNNIEIYNKYKDRTIEIVTRMVELFNEIYK